MIEVRAVQKKYGSFEALKSVSFQVKKGEILGFLGPNGAGKTTLMRILTGLFPPTSGQTFINGHDVEADTIQAQRQIGYLPENVPLYPEMRIEDYLEFVGKIKGIRGQELKIDIKKRMEECGIDSVRRRQIRKLSKGYKQRVGLAQALLGNPSVLILDEPTTGLDPKQIIEIRSLIKNMAGSKTIILSTHILPEVSAVCDRVIIINEGVVVAEDTPQNLESRLQSKLDISIHVQGDSRKVETALQKIPGIHQVECKKTDELYSEFLISSDDAKDIRPAVAKMLAADFDLLEMKAMRLSLEDIFVKLVTEEEKIEEKV